MSDWYEKNAENKTSLMPNPRDEYERKLLARKEAEVEVPAEAEKQVQAPNGGGATQAIQNAGAAGMSQTTGTVDTLGSAAMMSGNPYLMAAGVGMKVYAGAEQRKRQQAEAERQAYNERIMRRQQAMNQIASQGIQ